MEWSGGVVRIFLLEVKIFGNGFFSSPVYARLPCGVIKAVEDVQEHRSNIAIRGPIILKVILRSGIRTRVLPLEHIPSAPDRKGDDEHNDPGDLRPYRAPNVRKVQREAEDEGAKDLRQPVKRTVQGASACVEPHQIDVVELVRVEPIGREEHGEEEDDVGIAAEGFPETENLRLPGWMLH